MDVYLHLKVFLNSPCLYDRDHFLLEIHDHQLPFVLSGLHRDHCVHHEIMIDHFFMIMASMRPVVQRLTLMIEKIIGRSWYRFTIRKVTLMGSTDC